MEGIDIFGASRSRLPAGSLLADRYRIVSILGQGGMGTVYLAEDTKLAGKQWAVKELIFPLQNRTVFAEEARFLAKLSHPYLPVVSDYWQEAPDGPSYLVMEAVPGITFHELLERKRPYPWREAVHIALQLCDVLEYLHGLHPEPVIYRDLKPSNIMLDEKRRIRLIDFGAARYYNRYSEEDTIALGTIGFAAPEQFQGKQTDARTDLYALGAVLYYALSGGKHYMPGLQDPGVLGVVPDALTRIILKLLAPAPDKRHASAAELRPELQRLLQPEQAAAAAVLQRTQPVTIPRKQIVIGGLWSGSGTTFTAVALARTLHQCGISHALVELPGTKAELYHLLNGERRAPKNFRFKPEYGDLSPVRSGAKWEDGCTEWVPLPPERPISDWTEEKTFRLISSLEPPIVLADIGVSWTEPQTAAICDAADCILVVCDPSASKLQRLETAQIWAYLSRQRELGSRIFLIANKDLPFLGRDEWLHSLPKKPACSIPAFPEEEIWKSQWKGLNYADDKEVQADLLESFLPLLQTILPDPPAFPPLSKGKKRLFGRGK